MTSLRTAGFALFAFALMLGLAFLGGAARAQNGDEEKPGEETEATSESTEGTTTTTTTSAPSGDALTDSGRPRLAVHTFENPPNYYNSTIGNGLRGIIVTNLVESGRFSVIQRGENLELIIEEIDLGRSGYIEPDTAVEMGHVLGVDYILSGRVTSFGYEETEIGGFFGGVDIEKDKAVVRLDLTLIDATTGQTVLAADAEGEEKETGVRVSGAQWDDWVHGGISFDSDEFINSMIGHATLKAVDNLVEQILELFPVQASILAVTPTFVILDIGAGGGAEEGMEFEVYRITAVRNSGGEIVWQDRLLVGRVRIIEVDLTSSKAEIVSGSDFQEGDLCILPEEEDQAVASVLNLVYTPARG